MSHEIIQQLFEARLDVWAKAKGIPVAYPNVTFEPTPGAIYLRCFTLPAGTTSSDLGGYHRGFTGVFQISIVVPGGQGTGVAADIIAELGQQFPLYSELSRPGFSVQVVSPPAPGPWISGRSPIPSQSPSAIAPTSSERPHGHTSTRHERVFSFPHEENSMSASLPNGALLAIAATYGPAIPIAAVSNAKPAVATADAHGLLVGDVVSLVSGWTGLNGRAVKVAVSTEDTFSLGNIDTTDVIRYPAGGGIGSAKKVLTWQQIQQVMNPTTSGGEQQFVQYQYLEDDDQRQLPTFRNAQSFSMPIADDPNLPQWAVIEAADQSKVLQVIRLTLRNGSEVFYNGYVSVSDTPTLNVNEIMTRTLTIALDGRPVRYNPAP